MAGDTLAQRVCGACTACCVSLAIDDPAIRKRAGHPCVHRVAGEGCAIYDSRPSTCREFICGWRALDWVDEGLRPDRAGVLIFLAETVPEEARDFEVAVFFAILEERGLAAPGLAEAVARIMGMGIAVLLNVPGAPGDAGAQMLANPALSVAASAGDMDALRRDLRGLYRSLRFLVGTGTLSGA